MKITRRTLLRFGAALVLPKPETGPALSIFQQIAAVAPNPAWIPVTSTTTTILNGAWETNRWIVDLGDIAEAAIL